MIDKKKSTSRNKLRMEDRRLLEDKYKNRDILLSEEKYKNQDKRLSEDKYKNDVKHESVNKGASDERGLLSALSWKSIDELEDHQITYLLYLEGKTVGVISAIRGMDSTTINDHLIRAKLEIRNTKKSINTAEDSKNKKPDMTEKGIDSSQVKNKCKSVPSISEFISLDKEIRLEVMESMDEAQREEFLSALFSKMIVEQNADDLSTMVWTAGESGDERFIPFLHALTFKKHANIRRITYSALGKIGAEESIRDLHRGLRDEKPQIRQYCAKALANVGGEESLKILEEYLKAPGISREKEYVIRAVNQAIEEITERLGNI